MSGYLDAARLALSDLGRPGTADEITRMAIERGWLSSRGQTPAQTMKSKLSIDILRRRSDSSFMRTDQGRFGLRIWLDDVPEYVADRFQRALLAEDAVVFDATILPKYLPSVGLTRTHLEQGQELIGQCRPMLRREAEEDTTVIQLVSAFIVTYGNRYLTYKRSANLPESRLHHEYSLSFGGHLTPDDVFPAGVGAYQLFTIFTPGAGVGLLERELGEELRIPKRPRFTYRGLLYDDSRELSKQHLGIVYDVELITPDYSVGERGFLLDDKFESLEDMERRFTDFENWSQLLIRDERTRS